MKAQLRPLVAGALYETKSYELPAVCERYGLAPGEQDEAFSSKRRYVMARLQKLSGEAVLKVARQVVGDFPDDRLMAAIETLYNDGQFVSRRVKPE